MEGDLRLVREGHRDRLARHGVRTPRAGPDGVRVPRPRPCGLGPVSALPTLHERHASQRVSDSGAVRQGAASARAEAASVTLLADMGGVTPQGTRGMLLDGLGSVHMRQSWAKRNAVYYAYRIIPPTLRATPWLPAGQRYQSLR
jgi:hypothetical protein